MAAPAPAALPLNQRVGALVSRRQWTKLYQKPPQKPTDPSSSSVDEKPWPLSVQLLGYGLATTVVPYCMAWYIATNVTIRTALEPYMPSMIPVLRRLFDDPELEAVSYVDQRDNDDDDFVVPVSLVGEPNSQRRREQDEVDALMHASKIPTRLRVYTHGGFNLGTVVDLPGTLPVTQDALLDVLMKDRNQTIDPDSVSHVTVEFTTTAAGDEQESTSTLHEEDDGGTAGDPVVQVHMPSTTTHDNTGNDDDSSSTDLSAYVTNLTKKTETFSSWHYQPVLQQSSNASSCERFA